MTCLASVALLSCVIRRRALRRIDAALPCADEWPSRPVTVIVPFGAGGNTDMMARLGAQRLTAKFGQSFVIENRPSAGGAIGTGSGVERRARRLHADVCGRLHGGADAAVQKLSFDPAKQLVPLSNIGTGTQMISDPARTAGEDASGVHRLRQGQSRQAQLHGRGHAERQPSRAGAAVRAGRPRPRDGAAEERAAGDLGPHVRVQVDLYFGNSSSLLPHINSDKIRLIAVGTPERIAAAPDIPTVAETIPGFQFSSWNGFLRRPRRRSRS